MRLPFADRCRHGERLTSFRLRRWWLNTGFGGGESGYDCMTGWLTLAELRALPEALQPLLTHLCIERGPDRIQQPVLDRAQAANERNAWGFARVGEEGLAEANAHVEVAVAQVTTAIAKL